jgi:hypothetical protein
LIAPRIEIRDQAVFSGQAIATNSLVVSGGAQTVFPTLLWVNGESSGSSRLRLTLASRHSCEGIAVAQARSVPWNHSSETSASELIVTKDAEWTGYLYAGGRARIGGTVNGSILAELLYFDDPPTTYLNWLLDARISSQNWTGGIGLPVLFVDAPEPQVAEFTSSGK